MYITKSARADVDVDIDIDDILDDMSDSDKKELLGKLFELLDKEEILKVASGTTHSNTPFNIDTNGLVQDEFDYAIQTIQSQYLRISPEDTDTIINIAKKY